MSAAAPTRSPQRQVRFSKHGTTSPPHRSPTTLPVLPSMAAPIRSPGTSILKPPTSLATGKSPAKTISFGRRGSNASSIAASDPTPPLDALLHGADDTNDEHNDLGLDIDDDDGIEDPSSHHQKFSGGLSREDSIATDTDDEDGSGGGGAHTGSRANSRGGRGSKASSSAASGSSPGGSSTASSHGRLAGTSASALPRGWTMTQVMSLLICIPIFFLVLYSSMPMADAIRGELYIGRHKPVIEAILKLSHGFQLERRDSSLFLQSPAGSPREAELQGLLKALREQSKKLQQSLLELMLESDCELREDFVSEAEDLREELANLRTRVDTRAIGGEALRLELLNHIDKCNAMVMMIAHDSRGAALQASAQLLVLLRRYQNSLGLVRALGTLVVLHHKSNANANANADAATKPPAQQQNATQHSASSSQQPFAVDPSIRTHLDDMRAMDIAMNRDLIQLKKVSAGALQNATANWATHPAWIAFAEQLAHIRSGDPARCANLTVPSWVATANRVVDTMQAVDLDLLSVQSNREVVIRELLKMGVAFLSCVVATWWVVKLQKAEQQRLESTLQAAQTLSRAVQRFVPSRQLKLMGCRNIMECQSGLQVEVAQTMLFSDIRDFTGLSETMTNSVLFDWLQTYVSRMTSIVLSHRGMIQNFIGDAVFASFPQPVNGVRTAIDMHVSTDQLNLELVATNKTKMIAIGVGLHHGVVVAGIFGDANRLSCTMVASDVNLASRLEGLTKSFGAKIIASESVVIQLRPDDGFEMRPLGAVKVAGSSTAVRISEIFQTDPLPLKQFKIETRAQYKEALALADGARNSSSSGGGGRGGGGGASAEAEAEAAYEAFDALRLAAAARGVRDVSVERRASPGGGPRGAAGPMSPMSPMSPAGSPSSTVAGGGGGGGRVPASFSRSGGATRSSGGVMNFTDKHGDCAQPDEMNDIVGMSGGGGGDLTAAAAAAAAAASSSSPLARAPPGAPPAAHASDLHIDVPHDTTLVPASSRTNGNGNGNNGASSFHVVDGIGAAGSPLPLRKEFLDAMARSGGGGGNGGRGGGGGGGVGGGGTTNSGSLCGSGGGGGAESSGRRCHFRWYSAHRKRPRRCRWRPRRHW